MTWSLPLAPGPLTRCAQQTETRTYVTDKLRDLAVGFIRDAKEKDAPFFIQLSPTGAARPRACAPCARRVGGGPARLFRWPEAPWMALDENCSSPAHHHAAPHITSHLTYTPPHPNDTTAILPACLPILNLPACLRCLPPLTCAALCCPPRLPCPPAAALYCRPPWYSTTHGLRARGRVPTAGPR